MSVEKRAWVRVAHRAEYEALLREALSASARTAKALAGDRVDVERYEAACTRLEQHAHRLRRAGSEATAPIPAGPGDPPTPSFLTDAGDPAITALAPAEAQRIVGWLRGGDWAVQVRLPFEPGDTVAVSATRTPAGPAEPWEARDGVAGRRAVLERFRGQVAAAAAGRPGASIVPSGVSNSVLTDVLREFTAVRPGEQPVEAGVVYRDGSAGPAFPLRSVPLVESGPRPEWVLSFALLSIRHTEMDIEVDGAWLRNTVISRNRPAGDTDRIVFDLSAAQLESLLTAGPLTVYMYQTGLETAVMGFYRAVATALAAPACRPGSLVVVPRYFRSGAGGDGQPLYSEGTPWQT
jgi:hypothetical protein